LNINYEGELFCFARDFRDSISPLWWRREVARFPRPAKAAFAIRISSVAMITESNFVVRWHRSQTGEEVACRQ
jgi:hypothetical protein